MKIFLLITILFINTAFSMSKKYKREQAQSQTRVLMEQRNLLNSSYEYNYILSNFFLIMRHLSYQNMTIKNDDYHRDLEVIAKYILPEQNKWNNTILDIIHSIESISFVHGEQLSVNITFNNELDYVLDINSSITDNKDDYIQSLTSITFKKNTIIKFYEDNDPNKEIGIRNFLSSETLISKISDKSPLFNIMNAFADTLYAIDPIVENEYKNTNQQLSAVINYFNIEGITVQLTTALNKIIDSDITRGIISPSTIKNGNVSSNLAIEIALQKMINNRLSFKF